jgi:hypothetical protein
VYLNPHLPITHTDLLVKCEAQELSIQDIDLEFIAATPTVPYTFIQVLIMW